MPWFPDFANAAELARRQTRAHGRADPVGRYFTALAEGNMLRTWKRSCRGREQGSPSTNAARMD